METRPHGNSSGYHSDEAPATQKTKSQPLQEFHMPGMLGGRESPFPAGTVVQPNDVIITVIFSVFFLSANNNQQSRVSFPAMLWRCVDGEVQHEKLVSSKLIRIKLPPSGESAKAGVLSVCELSLL